MNLNGYIKLVGILTLLFSLSACQDEKAEIGKQAPEIATFDLQGNKTNLSHWQGKPLLLTFWSGTCGMCIKELKQLEALKAEHPESTLNIVAVNVDGEKAETNKLVAKQEIHLPVLKDQLKITTERYQVIGTPTSFFIDPTGKILYKFESSIPEQQLLSFFNYKGE